MQATRTFYQELFGWTFTDIDAADSQVNTRNRDSVPIAYTVQITPRKKEGKQ